MQNKYSRTMLKKVYLLAAVIFSVFIIYKILFYYLFKSEKENTLLVQNFGNCSEPGNYPDCWKRVFSAYLKNSTDKKSIKAVQIMSSLTCESKLFSERLNALDNKRKCHNAMAYVIFQKEFSTKEAISLCESIQSDFKSVSRFCMSAFYNSYFLKKPKILPSPQPLDLDFCLKGEKYITNCLRSEFTNYKESWSLLDSNIKTYCKIDNRFKDSCYVAYGSTIEFQKYQMYQPSEFSKLCKNVTEEFKASCFRGLINNVLIQEFDFSKAKSICLAQKEKDTKKACIELVDTGFLTNR